MDFDKLINQMGFYSAILIKWNNKTLPENFLDIFAFDMLWDLYEQTINRSDFPNELKKRIIEKINKTEKKFTEWSAIYTTYLNKYQPYASIEKDEERIKFVFCSMVRTATTFEDWSYIASYNTSRPYRDTAGHIDYFTLAITKMKDLAQTFNEWKEIWSKSLNLTIPGIAEINNLAFNKMCVLEINEQ